jgi:hypothetical protein
MQNINNDNYNNEKCNIYLLPKEEDNSEKGQSNNLLNDLLTKKDSEETNMNQYKKYVRLKTFKNELSDKEKDAIKEKIKDFTVKIFKSEEIKDVSHLKKDLQNDINTNVGREFFTSLLSKNTSNIILLKDKEFNLLGTIIYNTLLYILQIEENSITLGQVVLLLKSTRYFGKEQKETVGYFITEEKKSTITLWNVYKNKFRGYSKVNQANLWNKWYDINLSTEKDKDNDETKKKVILNLCQHMIELELIKTFTKNTLEKLINRVFIKNKEMGDNILQEVIQKIIHAKYVSKANIKK